MIVYSDTKLAFRSDVFENRIEDVILDRFRSKLGRSAAPNEIRAWKNSMPYMDRVLADVGIPDDARIGIEYNIPQSSKRVDFIVSGRDADRRDALVIVELKQWESVATTNKDAIVRTVVGGGERETEHPSYQAWTYAALLEDYNETIRDEQIHLIPCAYLHNCRTDRSIRAPFYEEHLKKAPVFIRDDARALQAFIKQHIRFGDSRNTLYRIDNGRIRPSKSLVDALVGMLEGNREFLMIDDQKLVFETALALADEAQQGRKSVLIVQGGPGTGKSVVAINLLVEMTRRELVAQYVSKNAAPRQIYESRLAGTFKKSRISNLFKGSGSYLDTEPGAFDVLIVDEAHRLNEKSGLYQNLGENQILETIRASKATVFFIDEDQRVTLGDIGETAEIRKWAATCGATVHELELQSQFRCNGSDGYLAWVDHVLQIRETANPDLSGADYDFRVFDSPTALRDAIFEANEASGNSRLVAGYCWPWNSKKDPQAMDIVLPEFDFAMRWNLTSDGSLWLVKPDSIHEVGCIHTCQGLDLDVVGVIIGEDFVIRDGVAMVDVGRRASADRSVRGWKRLAKEQPELARRKADMIVKNTYRTLMTRGLKGCFLFCVDAETNAYFKRFAAR